MTDGPALRDLPLILLPVDFFKAWSPAARTNYMTQPLESWFASLLPWERRLVAGRKVLPYTPIYLPKTKAGQHFKECVTQIANIPFQCLADQASHAWTPDMRLYLRIQHYFYQAWGLLLTAQVQGWPAVPPTWPQQFGDAAIGEAVTPITESGQMQRLGEILPPTFLKTVRLTVELNAAQWALLADVIPVIKAQYAHLNKRDAAPLASEFDLFRQIQRELFIDEWRRGPGHHEAPTWLSKAEQDDQFSIFLHLVQQQPWLRRCAQRGAYEARVAEFRAMLKQANWTWFGALLQALLDPELRWQIDAKLDRYLRALRAARPIFINDFYWQKGKLYKTQTSQRRTRFLTRYE